MFMVQFKGSGGKNFVAIGALISADFLIESANKKVSHFIESSADLMMKSTRIYGAVFG